MNTNVTYNSRHNKVVILKVICGIVCLTGGCTIYLLFRCKSLNIYQWCTALGLSKIIDSLRYAVQNWNIAEWIRFSLPDGLYCISYILIMDAIWQDDDNRFKYVVVSLVPAVTISSEILQYLGMVKGTFDFCDLVFYSVPFIAYILYNYHPFKCNNLKSIEL